MLLHHEAQSGPGAEEPRLERLLARRCAAVCVQAHPRWVGTVRTFASDILRRWDVDSSTLDSVVLVIGELTANAAVYGRSEMSLLLSEVDSGVRVEVRDSGMPRAPERVTLGCDDAHEHGRGLAIVDSLSEQWGVGGCADGWRAWARVR